MTTFSETAKTAFCRAEKVSVPDAASAPEFAMLAGTIARPVPAVQTIRHRNHETLTARGWLAHRKSWPKDQHTNHSVAIMYGDTRILIVAPPTRVRRRAL